MPPAQCITITEDKVKAHLDEEKAFVLAKKVFKLISQKRTGMPPKIYLELPYAPGSDFRAMPAWVGRKRGGACGVKWVSVFPHNWRLGLPTVNATIFLNSPVTGRLLAILEGNTITALRTAAASAVASVAMANPRAAKLAVVGAGLQAEYQIKALAAQFRFDEIGVWGYKHGEAQRLCKRFSGKFKNIKPHSEVKDCVEAADLIVTCTPSRRPLLKKSWVKKGAHINAIGADAPGKEELDPALLCDATVVVDEWEQASHSGEINVPVSKKLFSKRDLYAELAEIVSGRKTGRPREGVTTIFDSTGLAILDIYFAKYVYDSIAHRHF